MKKIFLSGLLWWNCYSYSQQIYFNNRYDFNNELEVVWTILPVDTGYLCAVGTGKILIQYINLQGELIWQKAFGDSDKYYYAGFSNSFVPTIDGGYVLGGSVQDTSGDSDGLLIKFNSELDTLWSKQIGTSFGEVFYQCKQTSDNDYILIGIKDVSGNGNNKTWLAKTDSLGNLKWEKTYNGSGGATVIVTNEGDYLFADGNKLTKTDTSGNIIWSKLIGAYIFNIYETTNGDYIGCYGRYDTTINGSPQYTPALIRTDTAGNINWQKTYGPSRLAAGFWSVFETENEDIITTGQSANQNGWMEGIILKTNKDGDSLWYREYEYNDCNSSNDYLRDIKPTADGGFIAAGFFVPFPFSCPADTGQQDMWVIKLDSCGCMYAGCDSVCAGLVGIGEFVENSDDELFKVYPNPANNSLTFDYRISQDYNNAAIDIYNIMGEQVFNYKIINSVGKVQMNTGILSSGVYFYALTVNNNTIAREKLIIIKQNPE